ncbi:MAG: type II toxin-antitoxin system PemK/MazF family toxin [Phormidesmis sp.]
MMTYERGDIVLVLFPDSNLRIAKRRPVLIVQSDSLSTGLNQTIVAMVTSNLSRANHPSRIRVDLQTQEGKQSGLLLPSVIMTDNLATIFHAAIDRKIGRWLKMEDVEIALAHTFAMP